MIGRNLSRLAGRGVPLVLTCSLALATGCDGPTPAAPNAAEPTQRALNVVPVGSALAVAASEPDVGIMQTTLPFAGTVSSSQTAWDITQTGTGGAGAFTASGNNVALFGHQTLAGHAILSWAEGGGDAVQALNTGGGRAGWFRTVSQNYSGRTLVVSTDASGTGLKVENTWGGNSNPAAEITHSGAGIALLSRTTGGGSAGVFELTQSGNSSTAVNIVNGGSGRGLMITTQLSSNPTPALEIINAGAGTSLFANSAGGTTALFQSILGSNPTVWANHGASGPAIRGMSNNLGTGAAGLFEIINPANTSAAVMVSTKGTGAGMIVNHEGSAGPLALYRLNGANQIRFSRTGRGFFNGGTQMGGADVAEAFDVEGRRDAYEPGDVVVISTRSDRRVEKSDERYSTRVIGVYATKPGVLMTERSIDESLEDMIPVGVVGVIPTKVSGENGAIRRGDLLVTAGSIGHAMRADPDRLRFGMVIGKALEEFVGSGSGVIRVLVNVK